MAKRYTDSEKYKNPFIRSLKGPYKLLWDYLYHSCDNAGIWCVDFEIAQIYIGADMPVSERDALAVFNKDKVRVIPFDGGRRWFMPGFIEFQHGGRLNPENKAHVGAITALTKFGFFKDGEVVVPSMDHSKGDRGPFEGPKNGPMVMVSSISVDTSVDTSVPRAKKLNPVDLIPEGWSRQEFLDYWSDFEKVRKSKKKQLTDIAVKRLVDSLVKYSGGDWGRAKAIMEKTIVGAWDQFYELKPGDLATVEAEKPVEYGVWVNGKKVS